MHRIRSILGAAAAVGLGPALVSAQSVELVPQAGYAVFGDLWKGPLGTSVKGRNGPFYGVQVGINVSPAIAVVGNASFARTDLEAGLPFLGGTAFGTSEAVYFDGGLQLRLPMGSGASPFLQVGAGGVRHRLESGIVNVDATSPAFHVGGGVDLNLTRNLGMRMQVRDYISKFDAREAVLLDVEGATGHTVALTIGLRAAF